jgi:hypothetical protein
MEGVILGDAVPREHRSAAVSNNNPQRFPVQVPVARALLPHHSNPAPGAIFYRQEEPAMNRLIALLAVSTLGTGCVVSDTCDFRTVSIGWPSFALANGSVTTSCAAAGVDTVNVYMDSDFVGNLACTTGGVNVVDVPAGSHIFTVEGLDGGTIVLRDEFGIGGNGCGTVLRDTQPGEGTFELAYSFTPVNECTPGGSYIWFSLRDDVLGEVVVAVDETSADPELYLCSEVIRFALPNGPYTLLRTEEAVVSGPTYLAAAVNCSAKAFDIFSGTDSIVSAAMADSAAFCP